MYDSNLITRSDYGVKYTKINDELRDPADVQESVSLPKARAQNARKPPRDIRTRRAAESDGDIAPLRQTIGWYYGK